MAKLLTVGWREFMPLAQPSLPRCPAPQIIAELRNSAIKFCKQTRVWRHVSDLMDVYKGDCRYVFVPQPNATVVDTLEARFNDCSLLELDDRVVRDEPGIPEYYQVEEPGLVRLIPCPREDQSAMLQTVNVLAPSVTAATCPKFLLETHGLAIAAGAKAKLMLVPDKVWSDPARSQIEQREFDGAMAEIRVREMRGGTNRKLEMRGGNYF
ncbi:hypothetical protein [Maridesulfovibrio ferrireducens]|uniref:hypothetical protein n=1 Tax=Maridesulfovibrio ferrireducens TaxID=246191 RepID=UPI001A2CE6D4|nr:hypothetical protein [Maridesulfovibrio ferrireducens]MBI9110320.1 hypothetical protein [Maridesulfovibrio ferrireducens]